MSRNLSFKDFEEFVRNRPQPEAPGFFKLWRLQCDATGYDCHEVDSFSLNNNDPIKGFLWRFPIKPFEEMVYEYYPTFEDAYASMMENDEDRNEIHFYHKPTYTFGYQISRLGFGPFGMRDFYIQYWMYDAHKHEYDRSSCSSFHWGQPGIYGKFLGRLPEEIHFKEGDIVEICVSKATDNGDWYSTLGIVIGLPRSTREIWNNIKDEVNDHVAKNSTLESYFYEADQDGVDGEEYFILYGPYDESMCYATFRHPIEVRPPSFPVPEEARIELKKYFNEYISSLSDTAIN